MSLQDGLTAFYRFEEAASPSISSVGDSDFNQIWTAGGGTPQQVAGVIGNALNLNSGYTTALDSSAFVPPSVLTWAGKFYGNIVLPGGLDPLIGFQTSHSSHGGNQEQSYTLFVVLGAGFQHQLLWEAYIDTYPAGPTKYQVATSTFTPNAWHTFECYVDTTTDLIGVRVDCGTWVTTAFPGVLNSGDGWTFNFGRFGPSFPWSGCRLDAVGCWNRRLTDAEAALICAGTEYPFGDDQQAWMVYLCGLDNGQDVSAAAYGVPTTFQFANPVADFAYFKDQPCIDLNGTANGRQWLVRLRRQGGNALDTSTAGGIFVALEFTYDVLPTGTTSAPGRSSPPATAGYGSYSGMYRGNPVGAMIGKP